MNGCLLDTNVLIWCLRGKPQTLAFLRELPPGLRRAISVITVYEVLVGLKAGEEAGTRALLAGLDHEPVTSETADLAASYVQKHARRGITLDPLDAMLAATARAQRLTLVTYNPKHFPMRDIEMVSLRL